MKKLSISLIYIFFITTIFSNTSFAQEGTVVATVNISNAKIVSNEGRNYKLSFDISNRIGAQPEVRYAVRLTQNDLTVDEKVYDESLSLAENTSVSKLVDYTIPSSLSKGTYKLWIDSKNTSGLPLGIAYLGEVKVTEDVSNTIQIIPGSCHFTNDTQNKQYLLGNNIVIEPTDSLEIQCKVVSDFINEVTFIPNFVTKVGTIFGDTIETKKIIVGKVILDKGTVNMSFTLPMALSPGNYYSSFSLSSEDGKIQSNAISFNHILIGQNGNIQNAVFDKTYYKVGDKAELLIYSTQIDQGEIEVTIFGDNGECSTSSLVKVSNVSITNISSVIVKDCKNPRANITLSSNGKILDSKNFRITSVINVATSTDKIGNSNIILLTVSIILLFLFLILTIVYGIKQSVIKFVVVFMIFSSYFYILDIKVAQACYGGCYGSCGSFCTPCYDTTNSGGGVCLHCNGICPITTPPPPPPPPASVVTSFTASPNPIGYNLPATISWTSSNSTSCTFTQSGGGPGAALNGTMAVGTSGTRSSGNLISNSTVDIFCSGTGASSAHSTIVITVIQPMTINLSALSTFINSGSSTTISWSSSNVSSCNVTKSGDVPWSVLTSAGGYYQFGSLGSGDGQFSYPQGIDFDSTGNIYVVDYGNNRVQKFSQYGAYISQFGSMGSGPGQFYFPTGIAIDSANNIYVVDHGNNRIQKFNSSGVFVSQIGSGVPSSNVGDFNEPWGITHDLSGNIYVADYGNSRIQKFNSSGNFVLQFGSYGTAFNQFDSPQGVAVDSSGNIYVADTWNNKIKKFTNTGTFVSQFGYAGTGLGGFNQPGSISFDSAGNIYVADLGNNLLQEFNSSGGWINQVSFLGWGSTFNYPAAVAIDSSDNIHMVDTNNNIALKFMPVKNNLSGSKSSGNLIATTTFTATCINGYSQSTTTSLVVGVRPATTTMPTSVKATSTALCSNQIILSWTSAELNHKVYRDGIQIAAGNTVNSPYTDNLALNDNSTHTYYVIANNFFTGDSASSSPVTGKANQCPIVVVDEPVTSECAPSQGTSTEMYVNRTTTWTATLSTTSVSNVYTDWSGTNITGVLNVPGFTFNKIYTTVGTKNITAHTTGEYPSGNTFFSDCSTTTLIKLDPGTAGEL